MVQPYLFILGRQPALSVAEIAAVAKRRQINLTWRKITPLYAMVEADLPGDFFNDLAGTIKLAEVIGEVDYKPEAIKAAVYKQLSGFVDECLFGFSWYGRRSPRWLRGIGMELKRQLKESGGHVRLVESRDNVLSSVVVKKNHLLPPRGNDLILLPLSEDKVLMALTVRVQEFADWAERDYGRPARDAQVGMLPPKLAHLMVNLAQSQLTDALLDPFCGSGTVLQEAASLGFKVLWGADIDDKGIKRTETNLKWLKQAQPKWEFDWHLLVADVRQLANHINDIKFGAVVTEPYLGPPRRFKDMNQYRQVESELMNLYGATLKTLFNLVKPGGRLVMIWPLFNSGSRQYALPLTGEAKKIGWIIENCLPAAVPVEWVNLRHTLIYERPDQRVGREIVVLRKV